MKIYKVFFLLLVSTFIALGQNKVNQNVEVTYGVKINEEVLKEKTSNKVRFQQIKNSLYGIEEVEFQLMADKTSSLFKLKEQMSSDNDNNSQRVITAVRGNAIYYTGDSILIRKKDVFGEEMLIQDIKKEYNWEISKEQKIILGHLCYKATGYYNSYDKNGEDLKVDVYAWFAPGMPISAGPIDINGLPGLILEASVNPRIVYYAKNLNLNPTDFEIVKPRAPKTINEQEYEVIVKDVLETIRERG